jgi:hypothetical protein
MKSILYVGATLMIGASIYGFVDYRHNSHKKEFRDLYNEEKTDVVPVTKKDDPAKTSAVLNKDQDRKTAVKTTISKKDGSTEPVKAETDRVEGTETKDIGNTAVDTKIAENKEPVKKIKKKKRINRELFSRAPIRDEEIIVDEKVKTPVEKPEKKDQ